jgi:uncharacterized membrane protein
MKQWKIRNTATQIQLAWILLATIMLVYAVMMSYQTLLRYDTFKATAFDLGNMDQVLWNTIHGRPFQFTNQGADWYGPPTRLAIHFEPIILPLSLLYLFHSDPRILLVFQTLALVSGAVPVFLLTRRYLPEWPLLAPCMVVAYLLSPALLGLNLFDFHPVSLATPLLLYAVLALTYQRYGWFLIACILAASCKEDVPLAIAMFGILVIWKYKLPRLGITLILGGLCWSLLAFLVIIPHFYPGVQHNNYWYRYEELGSSPGVALVNILLHPWLLFTTFITLDRFYYLASLFRSSGFLALLAPEWLLPALPSLAVNLLSTDSLLYSGVYHYNAAIIPFVILSAIQGTRCLIMIWCGWRGEKEEQQMREAASGWWHSTILMQLLSFSAPYVSQWQRFSKLMELQWRRFSERMEPIVRSTPLVRLQSIVCVWIVSMLLLNYVIAIPLLNIFFADHVPGSREEHIQQLLAKIPPDASVSAGGNLNPHLTERLYITVFPEITFSSSEKSTNNMVEYVIVDINAVFPEDRASTSDKLNQLVNSGQFRILARAEGVILLVRRT